MPQGVWLVEVVMSSCPHSIFDGTMLCQCGKKLVYIAQQATADFGDGIDIDELLEEL